MMAVNRSLHAFFSVCAASRSAPPRCICWVENAFKTCDLEILELSAQALDIRKRFRVVYQQSYGISHILYIVQQVSESIQFILLTLCRECEKSLHVLRMC